MPPAASEEARRSHALESLTATLRASPNLYIVDFGAANQANLDFFMGLGHHIYSEDLLRSAGEFFHPEEWAGEPIPERRTEEFFGESVNLPDSSVDAVLLWDCFQFLPSGLQKPLVDRLYRIMAPGGELLAIFHPESASGMARAHMCRVLDARTLQLTPKSTPRTLIPMNNRLIERAFQRFGAVKFFLTREHLREVLVRR